MQRFVALVAVAALLWSGSAHAQQPPVLVDGTIALSSLVSLAEGHLGSALDSLQTLAATPTAASASWSAIAGPLAEAAKLNVPGVYFFAKPGGTYWTTASGLQTAKVADRDYFKAAMAGHVTIGELVRSKSTGREVAVISVPIVSGGKVVGMLGASLFLDELSRRLVSEMHLGTGVAFFAVDSKMVIALHSDPTNIFVEPSKISPELDAVGRKMIENESGVQTYVYRGKARTMLFVRSKLTGWRFGFGVVHG
ncbi:MAG TPA: cache domain-containing protein [Candidatus Baltobacteraceae bacterium]|jgi:hypothetical protein